MPSKGKVKPLSFFAKAYSIFNAIVSVTENKSSGEYFYGRDNHFPNKLLNTTSDSGTATSCITRKADFVAGEGFADPAIAAFKINPEETANQLLFKLAPYITTFEGIPFNVQFNTNGEIAAVYLIPFQTVRKKTNGDFKVNPNYGLSEYKANETKIYPAYKKDQTAEEIQKMISAQVAAHGCQIGQIDYVYRETPKSIHYPIPDYFSGIDDIRADAEMSKIEIENAINGFMPSAILTLIGEVDNITKDANNRTQQDYLDDTLLSFTGAKGGRNRLAVLTAKNKEALPNLQSFDAKAMFDAINGATDRLARKVCRHMEVPPVLIGLSTPGQLGNNQELANYMELFVFSVTKFQKMITEALTVFFPNKKWEISPLQLLKYFPDKVWEKLTDDEIRALGGYAPIPQAISSEADKTINLLNSLSPLVANKVLDSLDEDELRALIGKLPKIKKALPPTETEPTAP